jgi:hypothetical protein
MVVKIFYPTIGSTHTAAELVGGLISYLNCVLPSDMVEGQGLLTEALNYANITPQWQIMTPHNLEDFQTPESLKVLRLFSPSGQHLFVHNRFQQVGLLGLLLLLIGKSVTTAGYEGWVNNRLRTFWGGPRHLRGSFHMGFKNISSTKSASYIEHFS